MSEETVPYQTPEQQENSITSASNVEQLASLSGQQGVEIIKRRIDILQSARAGSIRLTHPRDWVLFKAESGIYAYLQDSGCERLMDIWGIEVLNVSEFILENLDDGSFIYTLFGDGLCKLTGQKVQRLIGSRDSISMDLGRDSHPAKLRIETMKAARSNLDGSIVRHLAGLASVPLDEINRVFGRKENDQTSFNLGKGFGSKASRVGVATSEFGDPPACPKCGKPMRLVEGKHGHFWGCQDYKTCGQKPITANKVDTTKTTATKDLFTESGPREPGE